MVVNKSSFLTSWLLQALRGFVRGGKAVSGGTCGTQPAPPLAGADLPGQTSYPLRSVRMRWYLPNEGVICAWKILKIKIKILKLHTEFFYL